MGKKAKPPAPPPPRQEPDSGTSWGDLLDKILEEIASRFPSVERRDAYLLGEPSLLVPPDIAGLVAEFLLNNEITSFNLCRSVTGTDKVDRFEVVYNLAHIPGVGETPEEGFATIAMVVVIPDRENPSMPSLTPLWPGADFQEREIYDLVGVNFEGHPDLRRILLEDEFKGHPLQKDYPLVGRLEDMEAINAYLDEGQLKVMKEEAGEEFRPEDVPPNYRR